VLAMSGEDGAASDAVGSMRTVRSRLLRALFQFGKRAAGETAKFSRSGVELGGVVGAARLECGAPTAEAGELIRRQLGNGFGDYFDFHVAQYGTAGLGWAVEWDWLRSSKPKLRAIRRYGRRSRPSWQEEF
jgi:hypothetical protein